MKRECQARSAPTTMCENMPTKCVYSMVAVAVVAGGASFHSYAIDMRIWAIYFHLIQIKCMVAFIGIRTRQIHILHLSWTMCVLEF